MPKKKKASPSTEPVKTKKKTKKKITKTPEKVVKIVRVSHHVPAQAKRKALHKRQVIFLGLFFVGLNMILLGFLYFQYQKTILSFQSSPVTQVDLKFRRGEPTKVQIGSQQIDLPITEAAIENGVWQTSDTTATHLNTSARPGENGNVVIYGHNRKHLFSKIRQLKPNDKVRVTSKEGKTYEYTVTKTEVVKPTQIEAVLPTDHEVLTLYTCTGFLDSQRFIVRAIPTQVISN